MSDLQLQLSRAASQTCMRYLHFAQNQPADDAVLLALGSMSLGAATLAKRLEESAGLEPTPGGLMLSRVAQELRRLSQVPGDHSQALTALVVELAIMRDKVEDPDHD